MNDYCSNPFLVIDFDSQRRVFSNPIEQITAHRMDEVAEALARAETATENGFYAAGYVSYEAGYAFQDGLEYKEDNPMPLVWFGIFSQPEDGVEFPNIGDFELSSFLTREKRSRYESNLVKIKEAIARGDTYQVNYTLRMDARFQGSDLALYEKLANGSRSNYCAYLNLGRYRILSLSPELFFQRMSNTIITRPMKGTAKRGRWPDEDIEMRHWLESSEKNRAENIMIVDLLRNDLGRIAEIGTVTVPKLLEIERYPNVFQMTSTVSARLKKDTTTLQIFEALFPCGSITGAPKISTMSLIQELELSPRGVYCGAIGIIEPDKSAIFNVAIRTMVIDSQYGKVEFGSGGGITWDSNPSEEYEELLSKAQIVEPASNDFQLLETMRLENGEYFLLDRHLKRMRSSALYFDFKFDIESIRLDLKNLATDHNHGASIVRLLADKCGSHSIEIKKLIDPGQNLRVVLSERPVDSNRRQLYHKTTDRNLYAQHKEKFPDAFDVLLWNQNREITEFTNGNVVVKINGQMLTPSLECGLLPGTFRAELLDQQFVREKVITLDDLDNIEELWFINGVRKWIRVVLD